MVLIGCSASKLTTPAKARDLYTGQLFRAALTYAELFGATAFILSARHGLVLPTETLEPYDWTMSRWRKSERSDWGSRTALRIARLLDCPPRSITILAPAIYARYVARVLCHFASGHRQDVPKGWPVPTTPLKGLGIGQQKAWLKAQIEGLRATAGPGAPAVRSAASGR